MSKTLHIIRHAKSDWSDECADIDRGLNKRGYKDTKLIGEFLSANEFCIEQVFCSSARRARITCEELNRYLTIPLQNLQYIEALYLASSAYLTSIIETTNNQFNHIALIGHNPGLTELCCYYSGDNLLNLPTCGVYSIHFEVDDWQALGYEIGTTTSFVTPRQLKDRY